MKKFKLVLAKACDVVELYVPMAAFSAVFVCYILMIANRYVFYASIQWMNEISIFAYSWSVILACSYASRKNVHVEFSVIYDIVPAKVQWLFRLLGNLVILVTFAILLPYAYDYVAFMQIKKSPVLKVPFSIAFFPFVIFVALTILHTLVKIYRDIELVARPPAGEGKE